MFQSLQKKFGSALSKVRGRSTISEQDVNNVLAEIRTGLLEADVHFRVAKDFLARVKERCMREEVIKSLSPEQQILKVLSEELGTIFGSMTRELSFGATPPAVFLMCGLQGAGKTTSAAKLALHLKKNGKRPALVSVDVYRPAAMEQLADLAQKFELPILKYPVTDNPIDIARRAKMDASAQNFDVLIVDTAGRFQIDEKLMMELQGIVKAVEPIERLLVIDAMIGQQAVDVAEGFDKHVELTGTLLTKLDGDTRGGAALSLVSVTGKPIKFIGTGERPSDFEVFHPDRMASRLLDMGDVLSLLEKAQQVISEDEARAAGEKLKNMGDFTLEDFRNQLKMLSRMGPLSGLMGMLPGMGGIQEQLDQVDTEKELKRIGAILNSMTPVERKRPELLNGSRKGRIARGSGTEVSEVNQLLKRFLEARKMMKKMGNFGKMFQGSGGGLSGDAALPPSSSMGKLPLFMKKGGKGFGRKF